MSNKQILDALEKRCSIRVARRILASNGFPKGSSWEQIREKLKDTVVASKADFPGLQSALREILIANEKSVRIFDLDAARIATLRSAINSHSIQQSGVFATHFPLPVPDNILTSLPVQPPVPVAKIQTPNVTGILFSSVRVIDLRERLNAAQFGGNLPSGFDEVIGIKKVKVQTFDAVLLSKNLPYAYVLTDAYQDASQTMRRVLQNSVADAVNNIVGSSVLSVPANLLPAVSPLYGSGTGEVKNLLYITTTSSGKTEWMRGSGNCLRNELGHQAGMAVIGTGFQPYGIELEWPLDEVEGYVPRPFLSILGQYRMTYEVNPRLEDATVWGCATLSELEFVLKELMLPICGTKAV